MVREQLRHATARDYGQSQHLAKSSKRADISIHDIVVTGQSS